MVNEFETFEKSIKYVFKNKELLKKALTHTSYAYENKVESYERLEYLGDSILEFISSKYGVAVEHIKKLNKVDKIFIGQQLLI